MKIFKKRCRITKYPKNRTCLKRGCKLYGHVFSSVKKFKSHNNSAHGIPCPEYTRDRGSDIILRARK